MSGFEFGEKMSMTLNGRSGWKNIKDVNPSGKAGIRWYRVLAR